MDSTQVKLWKGEPVEKVIEQLDEMRRRISSLTKESELLKSRLGSLRSDISKLVTQNSALAHQTQTKQNLCTKLEGDIESISQDLRRLRTRLIVARTMAAYGPLKNGGSASRDYAGGVKQLQELIDTRKRALDNAKSMLSNTENDLFRLSDEQMEVKSRIDDLHRSRAGIQEEIKRKNNTAYALNKQVSSELVRGDYVKEALDLGDRYKVMVVYEILNHNTFEINRNVSYFVLHKDTKQWSKLKVSRTALSGRTSLSEDKSRSLSVLFSRFMANRD